MAAILKYLTLWNDHVLAAFRLAQVPPVEEVTLRSRRGNEALLLEPLSRLEAGLTASPRIGQGTEV